MNAIGSVGCECHRVFTPDLQLAMALVTLVPMSPTMPMICTTGLLGDWYRFQAGAIEMSAAREQEPGQIDVERVGKTTGKRVGGVVRPNKSPPEQQPEDGKDVKQQLGKLAARGLLLLVLATISGMLFSPSAPTTFSYSIQSYSETSVRTTGEDGVPKYETKIQSSFKTNVPGLAERLAIEESGRGSSATRSRPAQGPGPFLEELFPLSDRF